MEEIKKEGLESVILKHQQAIEQLQPIATAMIEAGFDFHNNEFIDLAENKSILLKKAEEMAKKESQRLKISFRRSEDYKQTMNYFTSLISQEYLALAKALNFNGHSPLDPRAFDVEEGRVILAKEWIKEKTEEYTIRPTERREQACKLVQEVKQAIDNLNAFVANNIFFGKGITTSQDPRNCLCFLDEDGNFHEDKEKLEFI